MINQNNKTDTKENQPNTTIETTSQPVTDEKKYTLEEVAAHNQPNDCWFAINGNVYDVTEFIASNKHPGGDEIHNGCGKDATEIFSTRTMGSGTNHSQGAYKMLENYLIGKLE